MNLPSVSEWADYEFSAGLTLRFQGCDETVGEALLRGESPHLLPRQNAYDWLGSGIYFWENNPQRALDFAR